MPGYPCCCDKTDDCDGVCSDWAAETYLVQIRGIVATVPEDCADCLTLNDDFILTYRTPCIGNCNNPLFGCNCCWRYDFDPPVCGVEHITFYITGTPESSEILVDLGLTIGGTLAAWVEFRKVQTEAFSCGTFDEDIALSYALYSACDASAATCHVTALP